MPKLTKEQKAKIFAAVSSGDVAFINGIKQKNKELLECTNVHGDQPLHVAIRNKQKEVFKALLAKGVTVQHANKMGHTPLHVAALCGEVELATILLREHRYILSVLNAKDTKNRTPLDCARDKKNTYMIALLLTEGATGQPTLVERIGAAMATTIFGISAPAVPVAAARTAVTAEDFDLNEWEIVSSEEDEGVLIEGSALNLKNDGFFPSPK